MAWIQLSSLAFFRHRAVKLKENRVSGFGLFPQATLLIHLRLTCVSFLTGLYLESGYKDLRCLGKTNMPEGKPIRISSTFSQPCKQATKYSTLKKY